MNRLRGKYALITGASRGLGQAIALDFQREGASGLALVSHKANLIDVFSNRRGRDTRTTILPISADLSFREEVERVAALALSEFNGRLDVLVNNASALGPTPMPLLLDYPLNQFQTVVETNLMAPYLLTRKLFPALRESKGSVINVTSDAGQRAYPGWGAYGISKFALEGMSKIFAAELKAEGVRFNLVDPGDMNTEMHRSAEPDEDPSQWADPADVTEVFLYLASDESRGVTGKRFRAQSEKWFRHNGANS